MLFSYLLHYVLVACNGIGFKSCFFPMYGTVFACFALTKIMINRVMTKQMFWYERTSPFKHVHIIQGKILYEFLLLNGYWIIWVSFAVKYTCCCM